MGLLLLPLACGDEDGASGTGAEASTGLAASTGTDTAAPTTDDDGTTAPDGSEMADGDTAATTDAECEPAGGSAVTEDIMLTAADGTGLVATYSAPEQGTCLPALVLVHQYQRDRTQWAAVTEQFVDAGYATVALDLRGHGESDPQQGALSDVLSDPQQAPQDVASAVDWLAGAERVDAERIAAVGTSIGANLALVALHQQRVSAAVSISPRLEAVLALADMPEALDVSNIYCVAAEDDGGGAQAQTCTEVVDSATGSTELLILEGSAHGVTIVEQNPELPASIIDFIEGQ